MRNITKMLGGLAALLIAILLYNSSWFAAPPADPRVKIIAHRGVHQTFSNIGLENDTCTAERIETPTHNFLENTVASATHAFALGADIVEFDIAPTSDGHLAIFHDWTLDCRTDGYGEIRAATRAQLQALDIGYGYTSDGGHTFPFRGQAIGQMPELPDMFSQVEAGNFLINFKSNDPEEAEMLVAILRENPEWKTHIWTTYGGQKPAEKFNELMPEIGAFGTKTAKDCLIKYLSLGWTGHIPASCHNTKILVPLNLSPLMWGWPNRFMQRMQNAGSEIVLIGPFNPQNLGTVGIDDAETLAQIPDAFSGYIWTNKIEIIGPLLNAQSPALTNQEN